MQNLVFATSLYMGLFCLAKCILFYFHIKEKIKLPRRKFCQEKKWNMTTQLSWKRSRGMPSLYLMEKWGISVITLSRTIFLDHNRGENEIVSAPSDSVRIHVSISIFLYFGGSSESLGSCDSLHLNLRQCKEDQLYEYISLKEFQFLQQSVFALVYVSYSFKVFNPIPITGECKPPITEQLCLHSSRCFRYTREQVIIYYSSVHKLYSCADISQYLHFQLFSPT
jgi:hypothetical protein